MFEMELADFKQLPGYGAFLSGADEGQIVCGFFRCTRKLASAFKIQEGLRENIRLSPPFYAITKYPTPANYIQLLGNLNMVVKTYFVINYKLLFNN